MILDVVPPRLVVLFFRIVLAFGNGRQYRSSAVFSTVCDIGVRMPLRNRQAMYRRVLVFWDSDIQFVQHPLTNGRNYGDGYGIP